MSDKLISNLEEKPILADTDAIVVEGGGATWKSSISKFKEYVFGFFGITSSTDPSDYVIVKKLTGEVYKVTLDNLLPLGAVKTAMYADSTSATTGITANKLAPGSVTHPKLAIDAVHTHNIADAEAVSQANYGTSNFGTGITTSKIVDGAVTGPKGGVPVGAVFHFASLSVPAGYLLCNGDVISDNPSGFTQSIPNWKLKGLRDIIGTSFGAAGSLPDLRGLFVRGYGGSSGAVGGNGDTTYRHLITVYDPPSQTTGAAAAMPAGIAWTADSSALSYTLVYSKDRYFQTGVYEISGITTTFKVVTGLGGTQDKWWYRVYSIRPLVSEAFGQVQSDKNKLHYHDTYEIAHGHTVTGSITAKQDAHTHKCSIYKYHADSDGGTHFLNPYDRGNGKQDFFTDAQTPTISVTNTLSIKTNTTGLIVRDSPQPPVSVDESRPVNLALLPCIKY
jgi:hypothetical protein